jgi:hypothetical protein
MRMGLRIPIATVGLAVLCLSMVGCRDYEVTVSLNPDGSGTRIQSLSTEPSYGHEGEPSLEEFRQLLGLQERAGWSMEEPGDQEKSKKVVFRRETAIPNLNGWGRASGDIRVRGTLEGGRYSDVVLTNTVEVEMGQGATGRTLTYRETLSWSELKQTVIAFMAGRYGELMADAFPSLTREQIGELRGLYTGHLALFDFVQAEEEFPPPGLHPVALSIASRSQALFDSERQPPISEIIPLVEAAFDDSTDSLDRFIEQKLPGVELLGVTEFHFQIKMPGRILQTNADEVEGRLASWTIDGWMAFDRPVELFVKSEVAP